MRPLIISTYDNAGGAARSAFRLHQGLKSIGVHSNMLVQYKVSDDPSVLPLSGPETFLTKIAVKLESWSLKRYAKKRPGLFSPAYVPSRLLGRVREAKPDLVNLHWVAGGMTTPESIRRLQNSKSGWPLVWTLHDMWAFTGGCHYDAECGRYRDQCGACPLLGSNLDLDLSRRIWLRKQKSWQEANLTIVTPSRWLAEEARNSALFHYRRIDVIPYGVDTELFQPRDKLAARAALGLPIHKKLVLFTAYGASDPRKGYQFLAPLMTALRAVGQASDVHIVVLGSRRIGSFQECGYTEHHLGLIEDEAKLAPIYNACDFLFAPSTQDNLPNTVLEALASGLPALAFRVGGIPDMIDSGTHGWLAEPFRVEDLVRGFQFCVQDSARGSQMGKACRARAVRDFPLALQAARYEKLYAEVIREFNHSKKPSPRALSSSISAGQ